MVADETGRAESCRGSRRQHPQHPFQLLFFVFSNLATDRVPKPT
jgi:hypothetical protein